MSLIAPHSGLQPGLRMPRVHVTMEVRGPALQSLNQNLPGLYAGTCTIINSSSGPKGPLG